ncbi:MAG TPA: Rrf2 family transcriptional regulator [Stenotrophomonas sp.]
MQLTRFSDYGLRLLMYLAHHDGRAVPVTIGEVAERFAISRHHLVKVAHFLARQGWVRGTRGKGGGLVLAQPASSYRLGWLVRTLESHETVIDCAGLPCVLAGGCRLQASLERAMRHFYDELDRQTLADLVTAPTAVLLQGLSLRTT